MSECLSTILEIDGKMETSSISEFSKFFISEETSLFVAITTFDKFSLLRISMRIISLSLANFISINF